MRKVLAVSIVGLLALAGALVAGTGAADRWSFNATLIEACSCPMFCSCYFNTKPAGHAGHHGEGMDHFCEFNNVFHVNKGSWGDVKLDGIEFWIAGDTGGDFTKGFKWAELTFPPSVTPQQREAIQKIVQKIYTDQWKSFTLGEDAPIEWKGGKDRAVARLDGGKAGEVILARNPGMTDDPVVIHNLRYWMAPRNDGFVLMPNEVEAYRRGDQAFEYKGTNGFMITIDANSSDYE